MRRRDFITLLGGAAATWPLAARAQSSAMPVIGYLGSEPRDGFAPQLRAFQLRAFRRGLKDAGFVEGQNVTVEYRSAAGQADRLPGLAAELVHRRVAVIVTSGIPAALAAKKETTTIPIVFGVGGDPVEFGLVPNFNRPGGDTTGVSSLSVELAPKRLELLHELIPAAKLIGVLVNPANVNANAVLRDSQAAAGPLGLQIHALQSTTKGEFDAAFAALGQSQAGALVISNSGLFINNIERLGRLALDNRMPTIFQYREFAAAGGLASYGGSSDEGYNVLGTYVGRILRGEKPGELPIQLNSKVELIINLKTAKVLGLAVPESLLARADEVIE